MTEDVLIFQHQGSSQVFNSNYTLIRKIAFFPEITSSNAIIQFVDYKALNIFSLMSDSQTTPIKNQNPFLKKDLLIQPEEAPYDILDEFFPSSNMTVEQKIIELLEIGKQSFSKFQQHAKKKITKQMFLHMFSIDRAVFKQKYFQSKKKDHQIIKTIEQGLCRMVGKMLNLSLSEREKSGLNCSKFLKILAGKNALQKVNIKLNDMENFLRLYFERKKVIGKDNFHEFEIKKIKEKDISELNFQVVQIFILLRMKNDVLAALEMKNLPDTRQQSINSQQLQPYIGAEDMSSYPEDMISSSNIF